MNYSIHTFELTLILDTDTFRKRLDKAYKKAKGNKRLYPDNGKHIDRAMAEKGITVTYHDNQYRKKVKLIVNPSRLLGGDDVPRLWETNRSNISELLRKLENKIDDYFDSKYELDDFQLTRIDFTINIRLADRDMVSAYIKVLQRIGKVKGFSPMTDEWIDKDLSFCLEGNSNGIMFMIYDKEGQLKKVAEGKDKHSKRDDMASRTKKAKGLLRIEIQLTRQKTIREYTEETGTSRQIADLSKRSQKIFLKIFTQIIPYGDFYKKDKAVKIIEENIDNKTLKKKMLKLLELIPEKRSLHLAQKALNYRKIDKVMNMFWEIGLSPVTIGKRQNLKKLDHIYKHM